MDILIAGVSLIVVVEIIIKVLKTWIPEKYLPLTNVLIGMIILTIVKLGGAYAGTWLETEVIGLVIGASVAGIYKVRKEAGLKF